MNHDSQKKEERFSFNLGRLKLECINPGIRSIVILVILLSFLLALAVILKLDLIAHYEKTLGAHFIGGQRMAIGREAALKLINQYFKSK